MPESCVPGVGVGVLLVDERNQVLLTLRIRPPDAGCWSIVGGKLEFLETNAIRGYTRQHPPTG